jgi:RNA polymerase sigma factor (sigma-70 family)
MNATNRRDELAALLISARPELHRYASRMLGSSFDGEDVVQDVAERALKAIAVLDPETPLKPWLIRIVHNRVVDLMRTRATRAQPTALRDENDETPETPQDALERAEIVSFALARFVQLPVTQRSVLILKDVLELSLDEIGTTLSLSLAAVKAQLHRARQAIRAQSPPPEADLARPGPETARYAALFNMRDWGGLRALLADEVRVVQHARATLNGPEEVAGTFLAIYGRVDDCRLKPARAEGRDVLAALDPQTQALLYVTRVDWRDGAIAEIHDYRHARYVIEGLSVTLAA